MNESSNALGPAEKESTERRPPTYASSELLRGRSEVRIIHRGEVYRLRATSRGKLLLLK